jgi:hypothetical protein
MVLHGTRTCSTSASGRTSVFQLIVDGYAPLRRFGANVMPDARVMSAFCVRMHNDKLAIQILLGGFTFEEPPSVADRARQLPGMIAWQVRTGFPKPTLVLS